MLAIPDSAVTHVLYSCTLLGRKNAVFYPKHAGKCSAEAAKLCAFSATQYGSP
jgi:hypothetical protein